MRPTSLAGGYQRIRVTRLTLKEFPILGIITAAWWFASLALTTMPCGTCSVWPTSL